MMKETKLGTYIRGEESYTFTFETDLSISEKLIFVNSVVDTVVDENNYNSIIKDLMMDYVTIKVFTDVDTSFLKSVDENGNVTQDIDIDLLEDFLLETKIVEIVKANAFPTLFDELNKAVDKSIEYKTGIHPSPLNEALASLINTLEKKANEFDMSAAMEMAQKFAGITGDLTPENVVKVYADSDIHKKNLEEIAKSKKSKGNKKNEVKIGKGLAVIEENKAEKTEVVS